VRLLIHDLVDEARKGGFPSLGLAASEDHRAMDVPCGQVLDSALALILVFDPPHLMRSWWQAAMASAACLDTSLLIRAEHVVVRPQRLTLPATGVQVEHRPSQFDKVFISRKDPALVAPGSQRV